MRYAGLKKNDVINGKGVNVSLFVQGCPYHCQGCFNPETWDFNGGKEIDIEDLKQEIKEAISANGVKRNFSVLGGDPLCEENKDNVLEIVSYVRREFPTIQIYLWTGATLQNLLHENDYVVSCILDKINYLIDGPFIESEKDLTLKLRGSRNQNIYEYKRNYFKKIS